MTDSPSHRLAVLQALFVTLLWSTSWVIIKLGLRDIPALTFAGLRYFFAFLCLLPLALRSDNLRRLRRLAPAGWLRLGVLGVLFYSITQGAQFVGLALLPAVTVNLLLNFTTVIVALLGLAALAERPSPRQWGGITLNLAGILVYFYPAALPGGQLLGLAVVLAGVLANAASSLLGRRVNREGALSPLLVTTVSMGLGALVMLAVGFAAQGLPPLGLLHWAAIGWLAVINTAFAFTLWNHTLRTLSAMESSIINSTMLIQIPVLAVVILGERLSGQQVVGMALAGLGAFIVQRR